MKGSGDLCPLKEAIFFCNYTRYRPCYMMHCLLKVVVDIGPIILIDDYSCHWCFKFQGKLSVGLTATFRKSCYSPLLDHIKELWNTNEIDESVEHQMSKTDRPQRLNFQFGVKVNIETHPVLGVQNLFWGMASINNKHIYYNTMEPWCNAPEFYVFPYLMFNFVIPCPQSQC